VDAFNRRDVEALLNLGTPNWMLSSQLLDASADFRGREGIERFYAMLIARLESHRDHDEALKAAGLDKRAMSANPDLVRSIYADWERGDYKSFMWADAELEVVSPDGPEPGRWKGLAAVGERWRAYLRAWGVLRAEAEEYREIDGERVLVLARNRGVGRTSGLDLAQIGESANVFHIRAGKVRKLVLYWNRERAFADVGIEE
jgi:ketosteroid isomerase-like protein